MPWFVAIALLVVPVAEIYVIIQVGQVIGGWQTVALLIIESALGAWLIKREGRRAWNALQEATRTARMPGKELADAALVLVGGTLLLTPGFITDIFGLLFLLPPTRAVIRRLFLREAMRRVTVSMAGARMPRPPRRGEDVDGSAVDVDAEPPRRRPRLGS
jgi:UPF0716 protein FxsA